MRLLTIAEVARQLPMVNNKPLATATVRSLIEATGGTVRRIGGRWVTDESTSDHLARELGLSNDATEAR